MSAQQQRAQQEAIWRAIQEEQNRQQAERVAAARRAAERQQAMNDAPRPKYALIVAVDMQGGFAKDGAIPWDIPRDLKWFKGRTKNQICVMGRKTYEDINGRLGENATDSVLPGRKCFVVSTTLQELPNAQVVKSISEVLSYLDNEDLDKTIFIIGGERLFIEGIALADTAYITIVNSEYHCDKLFPTQYILNHFHSHKVYKHEDAPDCRFTIWKRNG